MIDSDVVRQRTLTQVGAMVRLIEAANVLLADSGSWPELLLPKVALALYQHRLRRVVAMLPSATATEILAASETIGGKPPVTHDATLN
jgi:hypothetical protein